MCKGKFWHAGPANTTHFGREGRKSVEEGFAPWTIPLALTDFQWKSSVYSHIQDIWTVFFRGLQFSIYLPKPKYVSFFLTAPDADSQAALDAAKSWKQIRRGCLIFNLQQLGGDESKF